MPIIGPIYNFFVGTLESTFFTLPMEGPLNIIYLFLNFALIFLAGVSGIFGLVGV